MEQDQCRAGVADGSGRYQASHDEELQGLQLKARGKRPVGAVDENGCFQAPHDENFQMSQLKAQDQHPGGAADGSGRYLAPCDLGASSWWRALPKTPCHATAVTPALGLQATFCWKSDASLPLTVAIPLNGK